MKLRVRHRTRYLYNEPVSTSHHEARLEPRDGDNQRTLSHELSISPVPSTRRARLDYFGNRAVHFGLREPHESLEIVATSVVDRSAGSVPLLEATPSWNAVASRLRTDHRRDVLDALGFALDSPYAAASDGARAYALPSFPEGRSLLAGVRDLTRRIHEDFAYDPEATEVSTPVATVLAERRGVCQDFAHLQIACLRSLGLAARYVSGYLRTLPAPGKPRLVGADASHAWLATFVPDWGWVDFDPTNDMIPGDEHITVATGRDFGDATPVKGVILGGGRHAVDVAVDVDVIA